MRRSKNRRFGYDRRHGTGPRYKENAAISYIIERSDDHLKHRDIPIDNQKTKRVPASVLLWIGMQAISGAFAVSMSAAERPVISNVSSVTDIVTVRSISPRQQAVGISPLTTIQVTFNGHINTSSVNDSSSFIVYGKNSGRVAGSFTFSGDTALTFTPSAALRKGELMTVDLTTSFLSLLGSPIVPFFSQFTIGVTPSSGVFDTAKSYATGSQGSEAHSVFAYDIDGDRDLDMVVSSRSADFVSTLKNDGSGAFAMTDSTGVSVPEYAYVYDVDNDGDGDVLVTMEGYDSVAVFKNNGDGYIMATWRLTRRHLATLMVTGTMIWLYQISSVLFRFSEITGMARLVRKRIMPLGILHTQSYSLT